MITKETQHLAGLIELLRDGFSAASENWLDIPDSDVENRAIEDSCENISINLDELVGEIGEGIAEQYTLEVVSQVETSFNYLLKSLRESIKANSQKSNLSPSTKS